MATKLQFSGVVGYNPDLLDAFSRLRQLQIAPRLVPLSKALMADILQVRRVGRLYLYLKSGQNAFGVNALLGITCFHFLSYPAHSKVVLIEPTLQDHHEHRRMTISRQSSKRLGIQGSRNVQCSGNRGKQERKSRDISSFFGLPSSISSTMRRSPTIHDLFFSRIPKMALLMQL